MSRQSSNTQKRLAGDKRNNKVTLGQSTRDNDHKIVKRCFVQPPEAKALELPLELLMEIVSYCSQAQISTFSTHYPHLLPSCTLERAGVLRALSQTCRFWRQIFFTLAWERLEVCAVRPNTCWYLGLSRTMERLGRGLASSPEHAACVQTANVALSRHSTATVLPALVNCLDALPNLHTLQILRTHTQMTTILKTHFDGHSFPTIRTVILPSQAHNILRCCPEARVVICDFGDGSKLVSAIAKACKKVESIEGFQPDEKMMKRIAKAMRNLKTIKLGAPVPASALRHLDSLKKISTIELRTHIANREAAFQDSELKACIAVAREILRKTDGKKTLIVRHAIYHHLTSDEVWVTTLDV